jgi:protein-disulfide isomerase
VQKPDGGHVVGNPNAPLKLVEYMSYTCPHCAHFEAEGAPALRIGMIASGKGSFEVRHLLRDPIDTAVALLTNCVPANRFFVLHEAFLMNQDHWLAPAYAAPKDQRSAGSRGRCPRGCARLPMTSSSMTSSIAWALAHRCRPLPDQ